MREILTELIEAVEAGRRVAYTSLVETRGSTPQKAGAAMLVYEDGSQAGTLGGGCVEAEVKRRALRLLDDGTTELLTFNLDSNYGWDDGLICGGRMTMLVDPIRSALELEFYETFAATLGTGRGCTEAVVLVRPNGPPDLVSHRISQWAGPRRQVGPGGAAATGNGTPHDPRYNKRVYTTTIWARATVTNDGVKSLVPYVHALNAQ